MYTYSNYQRAKEEIEARRMKAITTADARNDEVRELSPAIEEIDRELTGTGLLLFKTACAGGDVEAIKKRNLALMDKRRAELEKLGLPEDYTDIKYACPRCSDSGFLGTKMCTCLKEVLVMMNIESSGMGALIDKQSFDNFDLEWYKADEENYKRMARNLKTAKKYVENFGKKCENLTFMGPTGTGKTHISTSIARAIISRGFDVVYDTAQNIFNDFESDRFHSGYGEQERRSDKYLECDLLIIDDLGTEFVNQFTMSCLYNLVNTRQNRNKSTIISTNLDAKALGAKYDGRIYSRIIGRDYTVLQFRGTDYRIEV